MLDMVNVGLRTLMCLGFILFVVRPMLMGMFSRETDRLGIEQAAELAVMAAFKNQFDLVLNTPPPHHTFVRGHARAPRGAPRYCGPRARAFAAQT